jgi:hypothetical protein
MANTIRRDELPQATAAGAVTVVETLRTGRAPALLLDRAVCVEAAATVAALHT